MLKLFLQLFISIVVLVFLSGCDLIKPENDLKKELHLSNMQGKINAYKVEGSDSVKVDVHVEFDYSYKNTSGIIEFYGVSFPCDMSYGGAIEQPLILMPTNNETVTWNEEITFLTIKSVSDEHLLKAKLIGNLYKSNADHDFIKNFDESISKKIKVVKHF